MLHTKSAGHLVVLFVVDEPFLVFHIIQPIRLEFQHFFGGFRGLVFLSSSPPSSFFCLHSFGLFAFGAALVFILAFTLARSRTKVGYGVCCTIIVGIQGSGISYYGFLLRITILNGIGSICIAIMRPITIFAGIK